MRKTSNQILKELELSLALDHFKFKDLLNQCIDDMLNFRVNELEALLTATELVKDNPILKEWLQTKVIEHARNICVILGVTVEGFKMTIEELERKKQQYEQGRNRLKQQISDKSKEGLH